MHINWNFTLVASEFNLIESEILHNGSIKTIHELVDGTDERERCAETEKRNKDSMAIQFLFTFRYKL